MTAIVAAVALTSAAPARAAAADAEELIRHTVDAVFVVLRDAELAKDRPRRMQRLRDVIDPVFDWTLMAQSSLGPHWRKLSDAERAEFVRVFRELLAQRYMQDIDRFRGSEQVLVRGSDTVEDTIRVNTVLVTSSRERIPIDYFLQAEARGLQVVDFAVENVSLVNHYRATFSRFLVNRPFGELLRQLQQKLKPA
ncbi:MAG TPA: ABC transporter substrate-binding protein [Polyangiaceae bacterium]|nr:ABC transporter substrate-binding protein [Polyangiaceae bacterium]